VIFPSALDGATPWYVGLFAMGAVAARNSVLGGEARHSVLQRRLLYVVAGGAAAVLVLGGHSLFEKNAAYIDTVIGVLTAFLLYLTFTDPTSTRTWLTRALGWGPLVRVGIFSYSIYLVHAPLLHVLDRMYTAVWGPRPEIMFLMLTASIPLIVGCAYAFHRLFERPFMTLPSSAVREQRLPVALQVRAPLPAE
jgi:peptidoglycan/LPS O-acetylase OafA/YrhL